MAGVPFYRRWGARKRRTRQRQDTTQRWHLGHIAGARGVRTSEYAVRRLSTVGRWAMFAIQPARAANLDCGSQRMTSRIP
jgi:hypothetical protein